MSGTLADFDLWQQHPPKTKYKTRYFKLLFSKNKLAMAMFLKTEKRLKRVPVSLITC